MVQSIVVIIALHFPHTKTYDAETKAHTFLKKFMHHWLYGRYHYLQMST